MEKKDSFVTRLLKLVGIKRRVYECEITGQSTTPTIHREKTERKVIEKPVPPTNNYVTYGEEKFPITKAKQSFCGDEKSNGLNIIQFYFELEGEDNPSFQVDINVALHQKEIKEGNFRYHDTAKEMFMTGELSFLRDGEDEYIDDDKPFIAGDIQIRQKDGQQYVITGDFLLEERKRATIYYEGELVYSNYAPGVNGEGELVFEDQKFPINVGFENYNGIQEQYDIIREVFNINPDFRFECEDIDRKYEFNIELGQEAGKTINPGEYSFSINSSFHLPGTFSAYFIIFSEEKGVDNTVYDVEKGTLMVSRDDAFTIRLEGEFKGGIPFTFHYTGQPEWCDES